MEVATNLNDINETVRAKDSDCEQRQEKVFLCETVEYSHTGESQSKPLSHQTCEEHPVTHCQVIETEHQLSPSNFPAMPSMSPKHDIMSETASGGRRRKLGSHRNRGASVFISAGSFRGEGLRSNRYNVLMVGDSSVGKTSFMKQAQSGMFSLDLPSSVGLDSCMWTVMVDGQQVVLQLWDTAGQERFHSITRQIFHKAHAFLLMYDITSSRSFTAVSYWANCIQEEAAENVTILLLGNKSDCAEQQVKTQEGEILATEYNFTFMECSAATGENVNQALEAVARILSQKADTRQETMVLHKEPQQKKSSGCC
uniref:RAB44, member RAS oncogene family n=1 Tax=Mola mola TaxID=94237 RepID=A0A3Q4C0Q0_MOLML